MFVLKIGIIGLGNMAERLEKVKIRSLSLRVIATVIGEFGEYNIKKR